MWPIGGMTTMTKAAGIGPSACRRPLGVSARARSGSAAVAQARLAGVLVSECHRFQRNATTTTTIAPSGVGDRRRSRASRSRVMVSATGGGYTIVESLAVAAGWACIAGSVFRMLPQCHRILTRRSVVGISFVAIFCEWVIYTINLAYNSHHGYAFSTYGDLFVSWVVLILVVALVQKFQNASKAHIAATFGFGGFWSLWLLGGFAPPKVLASLQAVSSFALAFGSRIPQIAMNVRRGDTGELSVIQFVANVLGCVARIFTTLVLTQDGLLLFNAAFHGVLNAIIVAQCVATLLTRQRLRRESAAAAGSTA